LPTSALAVRTIGFSWEPAPADAIVIKDSEGNLAFRYKKSKDEVNACPGLKMVLPALAFSAELVSLKDGHIIARIDEKRMPNMARPMEKEFATTNYIPRQGVGYTRSSTNCLFQTSDDASTQYNYIAGYSTQDASCANAAKALQELVEENFYRTDVNQMMLEVIQKSLDPLYGR
jgi:hypothetical protein